MCTKSQSNEHIWQTPDLDPNTTTICCIDSKYISNSSQFNTQIKHIEQETCSQITTHGIDNKNGLVWVRIKNKSVDSRRLAFILLNSFNYNSCKEIVLPKLDETNKRVKRTLTRSSTENFLSNNLSRPFSSILTPIIVNENDEINSRIQDLKLNNEDNVKNEENKLLIDEKKVKRRYTIDFLLARSDLAESKQLPKYWKELNLKYPEICFCGKVLSYFNPYKYYDHWIKIQNENLELHNPIPTILNSKYYSSNNNNNNNNNKIQNKQLLKKQQAQTDDYLNLNYTNSRRVMVKQNSLNISSSFTNNTNRSGYKINTKFNNINNSNDSQNSYSSSGSGNRRFYLTNKNSKV